MINLEAIRSAPVARDPFPHFLVERVLDADSLRRIRDDFPSITSTGIYPVDELAYGPAFSALIDEIRSSDLQDVISEKLGVPLEGRPLMVTVRGNCHRRDGKIHTDSEDKVVTCLLYLNDDSWAGTTGRLRLLRSGTNLEDMIAEVPPNGGTLVVFKRTNNSWHGHHPFEGPRRYVMFNWLTSNVALTKNVGRHKLSARLKKLNPFA